MLKLLMYIMLIFTCACSVAEKKGDTWTFTRDALTQVRGGTTHGTSVENDSSVPQVWKDLQQEGITAYEKDRRAILALQGEFKTKFEFLETFTIDPALKLDKPYISWGTEFVKVIEDRGDFISLQHIMVMFYKNNETGEVAGPVVMKHWRQDWTWQASQMWEFTGNNTWLTKNLLDSEKTGKWLWEVYQVDDSPRYSGLGKWQHLKNVSQYSTELMSRPLPRRERSVRSDYKVLLGNENIVVTANRWFHEQKSFKHQDDLKSIDDVSSSPIISREIGHNSYTRIKNFDFKQGYALWEKQKNYWKDVRKVWTHIFSHHKKLKLKKEVEGKNLYAYHFEQADDDDVLKQDEQSRYKLIKETIYKFMIK